MQIPSTTVTTATYPSSTSRATVSRPLDQITPSSTTNASAAVTNTQATGSRQTAGTAPNAGGAGDSTASAETAPSTSTSASSATNATGSAQAAGGGGGVGQESSSTTSSATTELDTMNALATSLEAQLSQASAGGADTSSVRAQLDSARDELQQAIQDSDTSKADQIEAQLQTAQSALAQLMVKSGKSTGLLATTA